MEVKDQSLQSNSPAWRAKAWALPLFWIVLGSFFYYGSTTITAAPIQDKHDPGPAAICIVCSLGLLILGSLQVIQLLWNGVQLRASFVSRSGIQEDALPTSANLYPAIEAVFAITAYIACLFFFGFAMATLLFGITSMRRLGTSWVLSVASTSLIITVVYLLFIQTLGIVLPTGVWGMPF